MSEIEVMIHKIRMGKEPKKYRILIMNLMELGEFIKKFLKDSAKNRHKRKKNDN